MVHEEYRRLVPGAKTAFLFIHGIVGTPNHFREVLPLVQTVPENVSVWNLLLEGHGKTVEDFANSSMKKWTAQVSSAFEQLAASHEQVVIVAHSMGTLFALELAAAHPERTGQLFLLAVPLRPWPRLFGVANMLRLVFHRIRQDRPVEVSMAAAGGVETTRKLWKYIAWTPRILELFAQIPRAEKALAQLKTPSIAFQSGNDELVSRRSGGILRKTGKVKVTELKQSTHFYYAPGERELVLNSFRELCGK